MPYRVIVLNTLILLSLMFAGFFVSCGGDTTDSEVKAVAPEKDSAGTEADNEIVIKPEQDTKPAQVNVVYRSHPL